MSDKALALYDEAIMPTTFDGMMAQAEVLAKSGLLPVEVKTGAAAAAIMLAGRELGIPPMQAFRTIYVVKGKVSLSAQLMAALIMRDGHSYELLENSNTRCAIKFTRHTGQQYVHEFTIEDAKRAGLANSNTWQSYPKAMLWSRCMSAGARAFMPDVIMGMYTPEELAGGDGIVVDDTGEVIDVIAKDVTAEPVHAEAPKPQPHWIDDEKVRGRFWQWTNHTMMLNNSEVYEALSEAVGHPIEHIHDYTGTMAECKAAIEAWAAKQQAEPQGDPGLNRYGDGEGE
jgi:hypothetical protein